MYCTHHLHEGVHELLGSNNFAQREGNQADTPMVREVDEHSVIGPTFKDLAASNPRVLANQHLLPKTPLKTSRNKRTQTFP